MAAHNDHQPADYRHRDRIQIRRALLSVSDKTGLLELAQALAAAGVEIVSTGGTFAALSAAGIPVIEVSEVTGFPETLDGRVKTLHPSVHAGILADLRLIAHEGQLDALKVKPFDLVVVNLYPFVQTVQSGAKGDAVVEQIDIGGPAMVRAAAKNHANVAIVVDPAKYGELIAALGNGGTTLAQRREFAYLAYSHTARYDLAVSNWFAAELEGEWKRNAGQTATEEIKNPGFAPEVNITGQLANVLRYGENAHQAAALYRTTGEGAVAGIAQARQIVVQALLFQSDGLGLLGCRVEHALEFGLARRQAALPELGFLRLTLQAALLLTRVVQTALGGDHGLVELGMALLAVGQLHVELFKARLGGDATFLQVGQLRIHLTQIAAELFAAGAGLLDQLGQAQELDLDFVRAGLRRAGFLAHRDQPLRRVGIRRLGPHQGEPRLFDDEGLGLDLLVQVLDVLGTGKQAGLLTVLRVKTHAVQADGVA